VIWGKILVPLKDCLILLDLSLNKLGRYAEQKVVRRLLSEVWLTCGSSLKRIDAEAAMQPGNDMLSISQVSVASFPRSTENVHNA